MQGIDRIVKWLGKSQGRDKFCKIFQYICRYLAEHFKKKDQFNHFMFDNLFQSIRQARKLFRTFKSISYLVFYGEENFSTILNIVSKTFYFFYWIFSNISVAAKIKLYTLDWKKYQLISLKIKFLGMIFSIAACFYDLKFNKKDSTERWHKKIQLLSNLSNLIVVGNDCGIGLKFQQKTNSIAGLISALLSTYRIYNE